MLRLFLKKKFWKNEIVSCVEEWIALIGQQHLGHKAFKFCATLICIGFEIGIQSDDISSRGPSKGVCQSPSSFFF